MSRPNYVGGLGFGMKWNMGWMHDTLGYFKRDPVYRKHHHDELTFSLWYAFHENFVLPLSHDEVVHGKGSLIGRMPGDAWQQFANLRLLFGTMWAHPGKKLLFMGGEFGQRREWTHEDSLEWHVIGQDPRHEGVQRWVADLNRVYRNEKSLHEKDFSGDGFRWINRGDWEASVLSFLRQSPGSDPVLVVCNFTPAAAHQLSRRRAPRRALARAPQQRRPVLWRQRHGQPGRRGGATHAVRGTEPLPDPHPAAARGALLQA